MKYDVHRFDIDMEKDQQKLKQFLNDLKKEFHPVYSERSER